jgi:hypothetical protein
MKSNDFAGEALYCIETGCKPIYSTCSDGCRTYEIDEFVTGWAQKYIKQMIVNLYFKKE